MGLYYTKHLKKKLLHGKKESKKSHIDQVLNPKSFLSHLFSGHKFKDLSRVQVNMYTFLYPNIKFTDVVFAPDSPITIIHDGFILWRLSNAFVVSNGILYGMITRRWLAKALTYTPGINYKLRSLKAKKRR